ncbi:MAG: hypothetical protein H0W73_01105 [Bacteroidetes bacterium]|nr:hypothetical protein [Bacteroidota bacterium]
MPNTGRDDARERIKKAAPSHSAETHQKETDKNKKQNADLKKDLPKKHNK